MSAAIPVSVPVFTTLQDDVDYVLAAHQNSPNDEISALATLLGMLGVSQGHSTSFLTGLQNLIYGCGIKYSSNSAVIVEAGQVVISNAGGTIRKFRSKTDTSLTASDLDSGVAFTNSTAHYIYATGDTAVTTPVYKISTNASAPSGYTFYRRLGGFYVNGSGNITFCWSDNRPNVKPGDVIYEVETRSTSGDSTTNTIPIDNTKPQTASEGKNFAALDTVVVPTSTEDIVDVELRMQIVLNSANDMFIYIAKDSDADALSVAGIFINGSNPTELIARYRYVPGSVSPITFKAFFGPSVGTAYINQNGSGASLFNGCLFSSMRIRVIKGALTS